jgi:hypothetical protein
MGTFKEEVYARANVNGLKEELRTRQADAESKLIERIETFLNEFRPLVIAGGYKKDSNFAPTYRAILSRFINSNCNETNIYSLYDRDYCECGCLSGTDTLRVFETTDLELLEKLRKRLEENNVAFINSYLGFGMQKPRDNLRELFRIQAELMKWGGEDLHTARRSGYIDNVKISYEKAQRLIRMTPI